MTGFVVAAVAMALAAAAFIAWPLLRHAAPARAAGWTAVVLLPLAAAIYYAVSSGGYWQRAEEAALAPDPAAMVAKLEARLQREPDDAAGWMMLGRSYLVMRDPGRAVTAYERAVTLTAERDVNALIGLGEALVSGSEAEFTARGGSVFEQAYDLAPDDGRALWYTGIVALRRGDVATARARWQRLAAQELPPDVRAALDNAIASLDAPAGGAAAAAPAAAGRVLRVRVSVDPARAASLPPGGALFVFLRESERGPPLAVARQPLGGWPVEVELTDASVMLPGRSLDQFAGGQVVARISPSGEPRANPGDAYGAVALSASLPDHVDVVIDSQVP